MVFIRINIGVKNSEIFLRKFRKSTKFSKIRKILLTIMKKFLENLKIFRIVHGGKFVR